MKFEKFRFISKRSFGHTDFKQSQGPYKFHQIMPLRFALLAVGFFPTSNENLLLSFCLELGCWAK